MTVIGPFTRFSFVLVLVSTSTVCHINCKTGHKSAVNATSHLSLCSASYTILSVSSDCWQCTINSLLTGQLGLFPERNLDKRDSVLIDLHSPHNDLCVPLCANRPLTGTVDHYICCIEPALNTSHRVHASSS